MIIFEHGPFRIRQYAANDCIVEERHTDGTGGEHWYAVESDSQCAHVYMLAFLAQRKKPQAPWTVHAGRQLCFQGKPFVTLHKDEKTKASAADGAVKLIAIMFNRAGITAEGILKDHLADKFDDSSIIPE